MVAGTATKGSEFADLRGQAPESQDCKTSCLPRSIPRHPGKQNRQSTSVIQLSLSLVS